MEASHQPDPSSPIRQPETIHFQQLFHPNALGEGFNPGNLFQSTTPNNNSAASHRPSYIPSKRTNPSQNFLPSTKYTKISEPRTFLCKAIEMQHHQAIKLQLMNLLIQKEGSRSVRRGLGFQMRRNGNPKRL